MRHRRWTRRTCSSPRSCAASSACIGATTDEEYERWIVGDPALERRFQKIAVRELSPAETLEILRTRNAALERHHNVVITDAAIRAAVELTDI